MAGNNSESSGSTPPPDKADPTLFPSKGPIAEHLSASGIADANINFLNGELPEKLGDFRIIELIGEGGMGAVYRATHTAPSMRPGGARSAGAETALKDVALKIIKRTIDTDEARLQMRIEWQSLARFEHPNIARFINCGFCERIPYMVMELAKGRSIVDYCNNADPKNLSGEGAGLPLNERLRLFLQACDALSHAHKKQVIHRDISAKNVRVVGSGPEATVKIIDFGISILLDREHATDRAIIGTPAYMSPEQLEGDSPKLDVRSDVYGMGVLLFELITGSRPYEATAGEDARHHLKKLRETGTTMTPSTKVMERLRTVAITDKKMTAALRRLGKRLRGDLDAIVAKALKIDPDDRYQSVDALAEDVRLFLASRPLIKALPPSRTTAALRFFKRNWIACSAAVAAFLFLAGMLIVSLKSGKALNALNSEIEGQNRELKGKASELATNYKALQESHLEGYAATVRSLPDFLTNGEFNSVRQALRQTAANQGSSRVRRDWEWNHYRERIDTSNLTVGTSRAGFVRVIDAGKAICGIAADNSVWFWGERVEGDGKLQFLRTARPHRKRILAANAENGRLLTLDASGLLVRWNVENGTVLHRSQFEKEWLGAAQNGAALASFSPDGKHLVVQRLYGGKFEAALFAMPSAESSTAAPTPIISAALPVDALFEWNQGNLTALAVRNEPSRLSFHEWRTADGRVDSVREIDALSIASIPIPLPDAFTCNGDRILCRYEFGALVLNLVNSKPDEGKGNASIHDFAFLRASKERMTAAAISADGTLIATGGTGMAIRYWDAASGEFKGTFAGKPDDLGTLLGHEEVISSLRFTKSSPPELLSSSGDGTIRRWNTAQPRYGRHLQPSIPQDQERTNPLFSWMRFIETGTQQELLGIFSESPWIATWDAETGLATAQAASKDGGPALLPPGFKMAMASASKNGKVIAVVRTELSSEKTELIVGDLLSASQSLAPLANVPQPIHSIAVSNDAKWLAVCAGAGDAAKILLWALEGGRSGEPAVTLPGVTSIADCIAFSTDDAVLGAGTNGGQLLLWDMRQASFPVRTISVRGNPEIHSLAFATGAGRDARIALSLLQTTSSNGIEAGSLGLAIYQPSTGLIARHQPACGPLELKHAISWNPANTRLATAENDGTLRIWAVEGDTWRLLLTHRDFRGYVDSVAWSADSQYVAAGCAYQGAVLYRGLHSEHEEGRFLLREVQRERPLQFELSPLWSRLPETLPFRNSLPEFLKPFGDDPMAVNDWALAALSSSLSAATDPEPKGEKMKNARTAVEKAAKQWNSEPALLKTLALAQYRCGAFADSIATIENFRQAEVAQGGRPEEDFTSTAVLAMALQKIGKNAEASAAWKKAQALNARPSLKFDALADDSLSDSLMAEAAIMFAAGK